jgi:hypothetical protein
MAIDVGSFLPQQVIFHKVPKAPVGDKDLSTLELAEAPIALTPRLVRYFKDRIVESLQKRFDVVYNEPAPPPVDDDGTPQPVGDEKHSPIPGHVVDFFTNDGANYVAASADMAKHLFLSQAGGSNEGILVLIEGAITNGAETGKCLVVLKLEPSEALTLEPATNASGLQTYDVQVHDVAFEKKARVFKAALFPRTANLAGLRGYVSDPQLGRAGLHTNEVAEFFLHFLGVKLRDTPERLTKQFLEYVDDFADGLEDPVRQRLVIAGMAELASNAETIDPKDFAERALPADLQDDFLGKLQNNDGSVPLIPKDASLVRSRIDNVMAEFEGGLKVWGPKEVISEHLRKVDGIWQIDSTLQGFGPTGRR